MDGKGDREGQGRISQLLSWAGPRTVIVPRSAQGFGFTLRHFVVYPPEPATRPHSLGDGDLDLWQNGAGQGPEPLDTIFVKTVRDESTAHLAGLTAGDRIVAVNGEPVSGKSYAEILALIHSSHRSLKLLVVPRDEDILQMAYQSQSGESLSGSTASLGEGSVDNMQDVKSSPRHKTAVQLNVSSPSTRTLSSQSARHGSLTGGETGVVGAGDARNRRDEYGRIRTTVMREDPMGRRGSREGLGGRPVSQDSALLAGGIPSRAKYSFGLYFPPRYQGVQSRATSADNLSHGIPVMTERSYRTGSDTSSSGGSYSSEREGVGRVGGTQTASPRHSYVTDYRGDGRYYVPVVNQSGRPSDSSSYGNGGETRSGADRSQRSSLGTSVTVTTQSSTDRGHRGSLGSALSRTREMGEGGGQGHTTFVVRIPVSGTSPTSPQHSYGPSFALYSPRHTPIDVQRQPQPPTQAPHIEVQSPPSAPATHIVEVHQGSPGPEGGNGNGNARSVWQRKVLFENGQNENNLPNGGKRGNRYHTELEKLKCQRKFTSVASRMASFEKSSEDEDGEGTPGRENTPPCQPQPAIKVRRVSIDRYQGQDSDSSQSDQYSRPDPPPKDPALTLSPSAGPVRIFVSPSNRGATSPPVVEIMPVCKDREDSKHSSSLPPTQSSPVHPGQPVQVVQPIVRESQPPDSSSHHVAQRPLSVHEWPRGGEVEWQLQDPDYRGGHLVVGERPQRKSSYLSAVNAPAVRYSQTPSPDHDEMDRGDHDEMDRGDHDEMDRGDRHSAPTFYVPTSVMSASDSAVNFSRPLPLSSAPGAISTSSVDTLPASVMLRKKTADTVEDSMAKLHRRTSYLMATARDRSNNTVPTQAPPTYTPYNMAIPEEPTLNSTPVRQYSLNKLKNFFGEQTPSIVAATERSRVVDQPQPDSPLPDITREGPLWCKTAVADGKKCSDRSWKQVWAVLRGHALFFIKDRREGLTPPTFSFEEPPVSIKSCLVDIAHDYSRKRKNVFRLTTYSESVYLLQAEDKGTMMSWIQAIKTNNNPDNDEEGIGSAELIRRKASTQSDSGLVPSPQVPHREKEKEKEKEKDKAKKSAGISFKGKFPHSPSTRRKKPEESGSKKGGWKGRIMPRSFKKQMADEQALAEEAEDISMRCFGVPLEDCFPSPNNEYVPLILELCTRIVEVRGLEVVGVYRVPGNSVAVNHMQEELNRGIENMNMDNDKWLDVNVVSSLLKAFLRKLPAPIVTPELYDSFIEANRNPNPEKRMLKLKRLVHALPEHHYETFKHLAEHLSTVAAHGQANKMDAKNLAIMFGPTLIRKVEDDTVSLVTDMSDQCRIIESVILHNDWFFSTWTQDHYVPSDPNDHTQPSALDIRVGRDDDEDADSAINTKEIISSIVTAANKKLKLRLQNKSTDSLDFGSTLSQHSADSVTTTATNNTSTNTSLSHRTLDDTDGSRYQERSVDATVQRATIITKPPPSLASSRSASEECLDRRTPTAPLATSEPDFLDWEERLQHSGRGGHHMSQDTLLERSDEVVGGWVGRDTLDWLKRLEQEARTIRRLEEQRQRDMERRRRQQKVIERELQRSQRDLEMEDSQSVEDILAWSAAIPTNTATTAWSRNAPRPPPTVKSDSALLQHRDSAAPRASGKGRTRDQGSGGKYFVSVVNNRDSSFLRPASLEHLVEGSPPSQVSRTGSLENLVDAPSRDFQTLGSARNRNSAGVRHGSLDSLLDMLGQEQQGGGGSSDSEDGSDLLTSLTSTFDQKLQILLNPKYRLSSRHSRVAHPHSHSRHSGGRAGTEPPPRVEPAPGGEREGGVGDGGGAMAQEWGRGREAGFRDPSLHRAAKSDTKVGIASRFEWGTSTSPVTATTYSVSASNLRKPLPDFRSFLSRQPRAEVGAGNVVLTQPRKPPASARGEGQASPAGRGGLSRLSDLAQQQHSQGQGQGQGRPDFRPISKSEKTEVNTALARLSQREGGREDGGRRSSPSGTAGGEESRLKSSSGQSGTRPDAGGHKAADSCGQSDSTSTAQFAGPATEGQGRGKRDSKRRHTVGGAGDLEHFKALLAVTGQPPDPRPSAWDQLCPAPKAPPPDRSLHAWMQKERLRGSTSDLLNLGQLHFSS